MIQKASLTMLAVLLLVSAAGFLHHDNIMRTRNLKILKTPDNTWRIQDNRGRGMGTLKTKRADNINWLAQKSAMEFRFEVDVSDYFNYDESLFKDGKTQMIESNKRLSISIREDAPADTLTYHVYVVEADTFVVGNSPPKMIIN